MFQGFFFYPFDGAGDPKIALFIDVCSYLRMSAQNITFILADSNYRGLLNSNHSIAFVQILDEKLF